MIRLDFPQGGEAWREARAGIVTASGLDKILTPKTLKPSAQAADYLARLVAEYALKRPLEDGPKSAAMERGSGMEAEAVRYYEFERATTTEIVGFLMRDDRTIGCSPDRLVGEDGGLEMKCPLIHTHVGYMFDNDSLVADYRGQVQGSLWITGRKWWDVLSYNPELPCVLVRVEPDPTYFAALGTALGEFLIRLGRARERMDALLRDYVTDPIAGYG